MSKLPPTRRADRARPLPTEIADGGTMTAVLQEAYGSEPEAVLRLAETTKPKAGANEVLVRVHASSVDRGTWHVMAGLPYPVRLGFGFSTPKAINPGRSLAGTVEAVGADVSGFKPGEEVFGISEGGSFADFAAVRANKLAPKPPSLSFEQSAAMPISGLAALQAVRDHARIEDGQSVLIVGASGGVGTFAVQIAKAFGAEVTGVCSTAKVEAVRRLGADHVIDYVREDFANGGRLFDAILDIGGNRRLSLLRRALTTKGRLVIVGGETEGRWLGGSDRQIRATLLSPFVPQKLGSFLSSENAGDLVVLAELAASGKLTPAIDRTYPLGEPRRRSATCSTVVHEARSSSRAAPRLLPSRENSSPALCQGARWAPMGTTAYLLGTSGLCSRTSIFRGVARFRSDGRSQVRTGDLLLVRQAL